MPEVGNDGSFGGAIWESTGADGIGTLTCGTRGGGGISGGGTAFGRRLEADGADCGDFRGMDSRAWGKDHFRASTRSCRVCRKRRIFS